MQKKQGNLYCKSYFKPCKPCLLFVSLVLATFQNGTTYAASWSELCGHCFNPDSGFEQFAGADYKYASLQGREQFRKLLWQNYSTGNFYVAFRYLRTWGIELGYETVTEGRKGHLFQPGETFYGYPMMGAATNSIVKWNTWHADLNLFYRTEYNFEDIDFFASVGVGFTRPSVNITFRPNPLGAAGNAMSIMPFQKAAVVRLRVGIQYLSTSFMGVRFLVGYDKTSTFRVSGISAVTLTKAGIPTKFFTDSLSASVGIVFRFPNY